MTEKHVLVCITYDGRVSSSNYDSLYAAQQAKSIALTGMTMEQVAEQKRQHDEARAKWDAEHPYREPQTADERLLVLGDIACDIAWPSSGTHSWSVSGGKIRECYPGDSSSRMIGKNEIKQAVVFKDAGDAGILDHTS